MEIHLNLHLQIHKYFNELIYYKRIESDIQNISNFKGS